MAKQDKDATFVGDSRISAKRIPNIAPSYSDYPGKSEPFWPNFLLKEWMVGAVCLVGFLVLIVSEVPELTSKANPTDTSFVPLPDWYFLFLYQLLKFPWASGDWVLLGTLGIPFVAFGGLLLAPWLDKGPDRRAIRRPIASGLMLLALVGIFYLTYAAMAEHNAKHASNNSGGASGGQSAVAADPNFKPDEIWTKQASCQGCHGANMEGQVGPNLQKVGSKYNAEQIQEIIVKGKTGSIGAMPGGMIKDEAEVKKLADYLASLK